MRTRLLLVIVLALVQTRVFAVQGWSNGGWSTDPANPKYGTHDWIAQHALDWLPAEDKQLITDNLNIYLYALNCLTIPTLRMASAIRVNITCTIMRTAPCRMTLQP